MVASTGRNFTLQTRIEAAAPVPPDHPIKVHHKIWELLTEKGSLDRSELLFELNQHGISRPNGGEVDNYFVRREMRDMCNRGFARRL